MSYNTESIYAGDCDQCGGDLEPMGVLGIAHWHRCRNCGAEHVEYVTPEEERDRDEQAARRGRG